MENENHLLDINIRFEPIPSVDFDDLREGYDVYSEKIMDAWVNDVQEKILERIYPDYEVLTVHVTDFDRDDNTCSIQFTTRVDWMRETSDDQADYTKEIKDYLQNKYQNIEIEVTDCTYYME